MTKLSWLRDSSKKSSKPSYQSLLTSDHTIPAGGREVKKKKGLEVKLFHWVVSLLQVKHFWLALMVNEILANRKESKNHVKFTSTTQKATKYFIFLTYFPN